MFYAILNFIFTLLHPAAWIQVGRTDTTYDKSLRELMATNPKIQILDEYTAKVGENTIWITNFPYASGSIWNNGNRGPLPRTLTRYRLNKMVMKTLVKR